jgi:hypothetical protein
MRPAARTGDLRCILHGSQKAHEQIRSFTVSTVRRALAAVLVVCFVLVAQDRYPATSWD